MFILSVFIDIDKVVFADFLLRLLSELLDFHLLFSQTGLCESDGFTHTFLVRTFLLFQNSIDLGSGQYELDLLHEVDLNGVLLLTQTLSQLHTQRNHFIQKLLSHKVRVEKLLKLYELTDVLLIYLKTCNFTHVWASS